jgi:hypothetical protein
MTFSWSWIFIFHVLCTSRAFAQSVVASETPPLGTGTTTNNLPAKPELVGPIVAGALGAVFVVVLAAFSLYFYFRGPPPADIEGGYIDEKPVSGRTWFSSKSGRFRNDADSKQPAKLSAVPRYLRVFRRSAGWSTERRSAPSVSEKTPDLVMPRSARLVAGDSVYTLSLPASASPTRRDPFNQMERSDRRKVQLAAKPIAPLPTLNSPRRKHAILPAFMKSGNKQQPMKREEIVQRLVEKQEAVAQLEEKGRKHAHQVHGSISSVSTSSTCVVDEQIEQDITELRQEVKVLEKMLPERTVAPPKYI